MDATLTATPDFPVREVQAKPALPDHLATSCLMQAGTPIKSPRKVTPAVSDKLYGAPEGCRMSAGGRSRRT